MTITATKRQLVFARPPGSPESSTESTVVPAITEDHKPEHGGSARALLQGSREAPLPPLPESYGPWGPAWNNTIAFCTVIRDENITDVREWLQYHKWLGVDHVYLTENHSAKPILHAIKDYINSGFVTYTTIDEPHAQLQAYSQCIRKYRTHYNWLAFFDADEYLVLRNGNTLKPMLNDYRYFAGLAVHWIFVGANNRTHRPEAGGVMRHYTSCWPQPNGHVKVIANSYFVRDISQHPHNMFYRGGAAAVNEGKNPIPLRVISEVCEPGNCQITPGHEERNSALKSVDRVALFHFVTKSREDYEIKVRRGGGNDHNGKSMSFFETIQRGSSDQPICHELEQLADTCCPR